MMFPSKSGAFVTMQLPSGIVGFIDVPLVKLNRINSRGDSRVNRIIMDVHKIFVVFNMFSPVVDD